MNIIKQKLLSYPCLRRYIKNILLIVDYKRFMKTKISPITEAIINKSSLFRTCTLDNTLYGIDKLYKEATSKEVYFEHGYYVGEVIPEGEKVEIIKTIYTISEQRVSFLKKNLKKSINYIEPYIVKSELCDITKNNLIDLKNTTNKPIRLFIPGHSEKRNKMSIGNPSINNEFTTIVLVYYLDYENIEKVNNNIYVSCGHNNDENYLKRLKALFLYSDYIETDFFGTHIIYADALNINVHFAGNKENMILKEIKAYEKLNGVCSKEQRVRLEKEIIDVTKKLI